MKLLECTKKVLKIVGLWLLGKLKDLWLENLKDYLKEQLEQLAKDAIDEISKLRDSVEYELKREEIYKTLQELYAIREKASKVKDVKNRYDSIITVVYPEIKDYN